MASAPFRARRSSREGTRVKSRLSLNNIDLTMVTLTPSMMFGPMSAVAGQPWEDLGILTGGAAAVCLWLRRPARQQVHGDASPSRTEDTVHTAEEKHEESEDQQEEEYLEDVEDQQDEEIEDQQDEDGED
ncbi:hypothetical protein GWK47_015586 [Chionoecetes opilio]|uniref:Uncharacterized protein n=1 Tax=Chionoecetes opilio TaxID=41210 RepID=A0A8J4XV37_CHIOP|nr:hypothetical protein GWK47_015586 [Chionoecetes opilio]